jgi:hypothetical protein
MDMTEDGYWGQIRRLSLKPSDVPGVYLTPTNNPVNVRDPARFTPEQRADLIHELKIILGVNE